MLLCLITLLSTVAVTNLSANAASYTISAKINAQSVSSVKISWTLSKDLSKYVNKYKSGKFRIYYKYPESKKYSYTDATYKTKNKVIKTKKNTSVNAYVVYYNRQSTKICSSSTVVGGTYASTPICRKEFINRFGIQYWVNGYYKDSKGERYLGLIKITLPEYNSTKSCKIIPYKYEGKKWVKYTDPNEPTGNTKTTKHMNLEMLEGKREQYRIYIANPYGEINPTPVNISFIGATQLPKKNPVEIIPSITESKHTIKWKPATSATSYVVVLAAETTSNGTKVYKTTTTQTNYSVDLSKHNTENWLYYKVLVFCKNAGGYGCPTECEFVLVNAQNIQ